MSAIFPTCGPWQVKHDFDAEGLTTIIGNVDGEIIDGTTHHTYDFVCRTLNPDDDSQSHSVAVANAEFIVRACNSHAALVARIDVAATFGADAVHNGTGAKAIAEIMRAMAEKLDTACIRARTALERTTP